MISVMRILKKKLVGGLKKYFLLFFYLYFLYQKILMLLEFWIMRQKISLKTIILEIKKINNITKNINFIIISNE